MMSIQDLLNALQQAIDHGVDPGSPVALYDHNHDCDLTIANFAIPEPHEDGSGYIWFTMMTGRELDGRFDC